MEALARHPRPEAPDGEAGAPDPYRTAVCAQMLTELCAVAGPFTGVLGAIRDEMVLAVYSEYYLSESGALHFDQVPHFVVVGRLEAELADMEAQQEAWKAELAAHQEGVGAIEQRLRALDGQAEEQEHTVAELRSALAEATERYAGAKAEAKTARDEAKRVRRELLGAKEGAAAQARGTSGDAVALAEENDRLQRELTETQRELAAALTAAASRSELHETALDGLAMAHTVKETMVAREELEAVQRERDDLKAALEALASGKEIEGPLPEGVPAAVAAQMAAESAKRAEATAVTRAEASEAETARLVAVNEALEAGKATAEAALVEARQLLAPEPASAAASVSAAAERGSGDDLSDPDAELMGELGTLEALGAGGEVPRFLRARGTLTARPLSKRATEELVRAVWAAKADHDAKRRARTPLADFLFVYLQDSHGTHHELVEAGYNLLGALRRYSYDADLELFLRVLAGEVSEEVLVDRRRMLHGLQMMCRAADVDGLGLISRDDMYEVVRLYFPAKSDKAISAIRRALQADAVGEGGAGGGGDLRYAALFVEDEALDQGQFVETILDQHLAETTAYVEDMCEAILKRAGHAATGRGLNPLMAQTAGATSSDSVIGGGDGGGRLTLKSARDAIVAYDPKCPNATVDSYLARGARLGAVSDVGPMTAVGTMVGAGEFIDRLRGGLVKRANAYDLGALGDWQARCLRRANGALEEAPPAPPPAIAEEAEPAETVETPREAEGALARGNQPDMA